jgi:hypothetical protein
MLGYQGPAQPSPTVGGALNAGYGYLEVRCLGCNTHPTVALDIVHRPKATPIHELERTCTARTALRFAPTHLPLGGLENADVMSTARILIKHRALVYRFLRFESATDGSLIAFFDRDARSKIGSMEMGQEGNFVPVQNLTDKPLPSGRFSIHTTGEVHRYSRGDRTSTIYIEPLHKLTKLAWIGFFSIPRTTRLDFFDENRHKHDVAATLQFPDEVSERLTFVMEIGPKPLEPSTEGVALHYELYSVVIRLEPTGPWPAELTDQFIHGMPTSGPFEARQIDKASAELGFYQSIHGRTAIIFREDNGGAYIAMAIVPMARAPTLKIGFNRSDLSIETIPYATPNQPTHKVRFWIRDKGGRNRLDDLRKHIVSVELNAEL